MTHDALLAEPEAGNTEMPAGNVAKVREFLEVAAIAMETWVKRLNRADGYLSDAEFDTETRQPLNEAAMLKLAISMTVENHLRWAINILRATATQDATSDAVAATFNDWPKASTPARDGGLTSSAQSAELRGLSLLLASSSPLANQAQLRLIYESRTSPENRLLDLLDAGSAAMFHWMADLDSAVARLVVDPEKDLEPGCLALSFKTLSEVHLLPTLEASRALLSLTRSSEPPPESRDHDDGKSQAC